MRNYKDRILDEEKNTLAHLKAKQAQIEQKIEENRAQFRRISLELAEEQARGTTAARLRAYDMQLMNIRRQLEQLKEELQRAAVEVDCQMKQVVAASQEVSKLDKLQDKQYEEYQKSAAKAEEIVIEEFVSSAFLRQEIS